MKKSIVSTSSIGILACIFLLINSLSNSLLSRFSVDLTEERLYSVSEGTKKILSSISEPIVIRYYYSRLDSMRNAGLQLYATRVRDLLREYARKSAGMITLEEYDPQPDSEEEEWAVKYGLKALGLPTGEKLYFGMVATSASGEEKNIPIFNINRQETLEYDITKSLYSISRGKMPKAGIISVLELQGRPQQRGPNGMPMGPGQAPWVFVNQLQSVADIEFLGVSVDAIPDDIDVLLVIHPKNLAENTRYAIDQYLMNGGSMFLAIDPYCASDTAGINPNNPMAIIQADRSSNLESLTKNWGVSLKGKQVVGDPTLATPVAAARGQEPQNFLVWLSFGGDLEDKKGGKLINSEQVITNQINNLMFAWAGSLALTEVEGIEVTPLIQTTSNAGLFEEQKIRFMAQNPRELMKNFSSSGEQQVLAAMLRGKFKSSFSSKPGEQTTATVSEVGGHIPEAVKEATVVIVSDVDFLATTYSAMVQNVMGYSLVTLLNENLPFAVNAVELLAGSDELIALRSKGSFLRPFTKVKEIEARAQKKWRAEEESLQREADDANKRLQQLTSVRGQGGEAVFSKALLKEMQLLREQRRIAGEKLREVRWQLRKDKESLGNWLFVINTFAVPFLLILGALYCVWRKRETTTS